MMAPAGPLQLKSSLSRKSVRRLAILLPLTLQIALMLSFMKASSPTYDEPMHLLGGLHNLENKAFTINPESGALIQDWIAIPNLWSKPDLAGLDARAAADKYRALAKSEDFDLDALFFRSRLMVAALNVLCGLLVYYVAAKSAGRLPALLAYSLYCLSPIVVSNGALATADMGFTFLSFLACLALWRLLREISLPNLAFAGLALGGTALCKYSAVLLAPYALLALLLATFAGLSLRARPGLASWRGIRVDGTWRRFSVRSGALLLAALLALVTIWAVYGFRFPAIPSPAARQTASAPKSDLVDLQSKLADACLKAKLLPEAFVYGFLYTNKSVKERFSFLNGETSMHGFKSFFPLAFLMKTPPPALAAFALGLASLPLGLRSKAGRRRILAIAPFVLFAMIYLLMASTSKLNIGVRHLLPVFPFLTLLAALGFRRLLEIKAAKAIPLLLVLCCAVEALLAAPHQLAYFSPLFGGPKNAYKHLVDSSLDWGQDLKNLKNSLSAHGVPTDGSIPIYLAYFGGAPVERCEFPATFISSPVDGYSQARPAPLTPGVYCVSATILQGIDSPQAKTSALEDGESLALMKKAFATMDAIAKSGNQALLEKLRDERNPLFEKAVEYDVLRFELLRRLLRKREPLFDCNASILVFEVRAEDLREALGPYGMI